MSGRFRFTDPAAGDFELPDVESVLDALEAALVTPDTPVLDAARQSWQPVAQHPEIRAAWVERARYRPPGSGLDLPPLPDEASPGEPGDAARRRAAYALVLRGNRVPAEDAPPPEPTPRRSIAAGLALVLVALVLIGAAVVELAGGLVRVAARAVRLSP
ncbi:MAG TPA: hypothetical protein VHG35_09655 [Gemmatimonadales bacterium]|nr:hypothetical protein [Gemmatimonadales bacterium]